MPGGKGTVPEWDPELDQRDVLLAPEWPKMAFIEGRFAHDPTNWWIPNQPCIEAMLRSSGFKIVNRPGDEIFLCEPGAKDASDLSRLAEAELKAAVGVESST
jgi:tRNA (mo5U34)-methyltransferase